MLKHITAFAEEYGPPVGQWLLTKAAKVMAGIVVCNLILFGIMNLLTAANLASPQTAAIIAVNAMGAGLVGGYVFKLKKKATPAVREGIKRATKTYRERKQAD